MTDIEWASGTWIHGPKHRKDNQSPSLKRPCTVSVLGMLAHPAWAGAQSHQVWQRCWNIPGRKWNTHDDVIKWKHFPRYWPFVRGIHRSPVNSPHKGQWCGALMFSVICVWINDWVNNREAGDLRRYRAHYDVTLMRKPLVMKGHIRSVS